MKGFFNFQKTIAMKRERLQELAIHCGIKEETLQESSNHSCDFESFIEFKSKTYRMIRSQAILKLEYPITSLNQKSIDWFGIKLDYTYSRQGLLLRQPLKSLYGISSFDREQEAGLFVNSCQAAHRSLVFLLGQSHTYDKLDSSQNIYFETLPLLTSECSKNSQQEGGLIILDTSDPDFSFPEAPKPESTYIVDTTCLFLNDSALKRWIKKCRDTSTPCALTRSHNKLDSEGVEYSLLGSIVLINMESFPLLPGEIPFFDELRALIAREGQFPSPEQVFPFFAAPNREVEFSKREKRLAHMRGALEAKLANHRVVFANHNLSFEIETGCEFSNDIRLKARAFINSIRKKTGFPIYFTDSFGFDFFSVTILKRQNKAYFRFSFGDILEQEQTQCLELIRKIVKSLGDLSTK